MRFGFLCCPCACRHGDERAHADDDRHHGQKCREDRRKTPRADLVLERALLNAGCPQIAKRGDAQQDCAADQIPTHHRMTPVDFRKLPVSAANFVMNGPYWSWDMKFGMRLSSP